MIADLRAWILERHREEESRLAQSCYRDRLAAAYAAPWSTDEGQAAAPRQDSEREKAIAFYAAAFYHQGDEDAVWDQNDGPLKETQERGSLYLGLCKSQTGDTIPDEALERRRRDSIALRETSHEIARRLEGEGFEAYRHEGFSLWHFYVHSNHLERIPNFRRVIILPHVASMTRAGLLMAAESFIENHPFSRFWTFTSGRRCNVLQVRERVQAMHRKISLLNVQPFMVSAGVSIVLRSTELGTPERRDSAGAGEISEENGDFFFHPHAHCIAHLSKGFIGKEKWNALLESVWKYWGDHWDDGSVICDARECLKYVTKPGEMLRLPAAKLAELARQLRRLKLAQPMGILSAQIKARKDASPPLRLIRVATPDGPVLREVLDWNRLPPSTDEEKRFRAALKLGRESPGHPMTRIVSRLLPAIGPAGVKEPRVVVMTNERLDVALLRQHPAVAPIIACSAAEFCAGLAIRVHTCTPTVLPGFDVSGFSSWKPPDPGSIAEFFAIPAARPTYSPHNFEVSASPKEGERASVTCADGSKRDLILGRAWVSKGGTVRVDIAPGQGFRPGTSVDSCNIAHLMGALL